MADAPLSRNPLSMAGAALTTLSALAFAIYITLEWLELLASPYAGLLGFLFIPAVFVLGLALIPLGMWREGRRRRRGRAAWAWPAIDLGRSRTRAIVAGIAILTLVNLAIVSVATVGVVHYTESNGFCGQVCHTPMTPEFTAHGFSPHARVECVSCHVRPGASGLISAKLNGTRQLYLLATGGFSRPIPEPIDRIPGAVDTCTHCHTPGRPDSDVVRTISSYADDEKSTESATSLTMHLGAVHWHARPDVIVEYAATDASRQTIPYVRTTDAQGKTVEYFAEGTTVAPSGPLHRMDCLDCHNRPAHTFSASPDRAVDALIAAGGVSRELPFVRREMVAALKSEYPSADAADAAIATRLRESFRAVDGRLAPEVARAVTATQQLYRRNVFPTMKITWGTYPSNLGHADAPGCFRCHDESHKSTAGAVVRQDCEQCHKVQ